MWLLYPQFSTGWGCCCFVYQWEVELALQDAHQKKSERELETPPEPSPSSWKLFWGWSVAKKKRVFQPLRPAADVWVMAVSSWGPTLSLKLANCQGTKLRASLFGWGWALHLPLTPNAFARYPYTSWPRLDRTATLCLAIQGFTNRFHSLEPSPGTTCARMNAWESFEGPWKVISVTSVSDSCFQLKGKDRRRWLSKVLLL